MGITMRMVPISLIGPVCLFGLGACAGAAPETVSTQVEQRQEKSCSPLPDGLRITSSSAEGRNAERLGVRFGDGLGEELELTRVSLLSGRCAPFVEEVLLQLVQLEDGSVYRITSEGQVVVPADHVLDAFEAGKLGAAEIPSISGARFLDADDYMMLQTETGRAQGYVGLWTDGSSWTVGSFAVPEEGGTPTDVRPLVRSTVPLRGVAFFPSIDTPAGQVWLVQDAGENEARVIVLQWRHGNTPDGRTVPWRR